LDVRDDFVEKLSHDCYVLQLSEIHQRRRNKLERLLSIFEQLNLKVNQHLKEFADLLPDEFSVIVERLQHAALDETLLKEIELEKEFMNSWLDQEKTLEASKQEALKAKQREQEAKQREQEERRQKEEERRQKEEERRQKEEERRQKEELLASRKSTYEQLIKSGMPKEQVLNILNLKEAP
jgi:acetyl/propionyl-CoA carboxylase alpha subunit